MLSNIQCYVPPEPLLWHGRKDTLSKERYFQLVNCVDISKHSLQKTSQAIALLGFCSDEGIKRNEGRIGARLGPDKIREYFAKLASDVDIHLIDVGNIICSEGQLELAQEQFAHLIHYCQQQGYHTVALGGGHEIAWPHFYGLSNSSPKIGIINFDAHFDIRNPEQNGSTSGTSFAQIKAFCDEQQRQFAYCCIGIQPDSNTKNLLKKAQEWNVQYLTAEEIYSTDFKAQRKFLDDFLFQQDYLYLSLCLDVIAECYAPGVSAPQALGLTPWQVLPLLKYILQTGKVRGFDIAELSPPLDQQDKTARLAAGTLGELIKFI